MKRIQLWAVDTAGTAPSARPVEAVDNAETEKLLEDLIVASPELLASGLNLVGRQVPCAGGIIDLLGIDQDGRITVFELKRGLLTRDAVAQILDYASELAELGLGSLATLVEENSGRLGVEKIEDFADWYSQEYPLSEDSLSETPRMVLVGLGVDDRARRIVGFLAKSGVDVELLSFHAFREDGRLLLGRQIEIEGPSAQARDKRSTITKEGNRAILHQRAEAAGLKSLLEEVRGFVEAQLALQDYYCWPGKTTYTFSLREKTAAGRPTYRAYASLYVELPPRPALLLSFAPRAVSELGTPVDLFCQKIPAAERNRNNWSALEFRITPEMWPKLQNPLEQLLKAIVEAWKLAAATPEGED